MPSHVIQRVATEAELTVLRNMLANAPTPTRRWKQGIEYALVLWAASLFGLVMVWLASAWLARKLLNIEFGLHSSAALWFLGAAIPLSAVYAAVSSVRWIKGWKDYRPLLRADTDGSQVVEEHYVFTEAKRFQEQEHGGLIYFLRTAEDKVLTLFDHESQDRGVQAEDPLRSSFKPKSELVMVRAPNAGFVISTNFSGEVLETGDPIDLNADPKEWPESESYCNIPWADLEKRLGTVSATLAA